MNFTSLFILQYVLIYCTMLQLFYWNYILQTSMCVSVLRQNILYPFKPRGPQTFTIILKVVIILSVFLLYIK